MIKQVYQAVVNLKDVTNYYEILEKILKAVHVRTSCINAYTYDGENLIMYVIKSHDVQDQYVTIEMEISDEPINVHDLVNYVHAYNRNILDKKLIDENLNKKHALSTLNINDGVVTIICDGDITILQDEYKLTINKDHIGEFATIERTDVLRNGVVEDNNTKEFVATFKDQLTEEEIQDTLKNIQNIFDELLVEDKPFEQLSLEETFAAKHDKDRKEFTELVQSLDDIDNGKEVKPSVKKLGEMNEREKNVKIMKDLLVDVRSVDGFTTTMASAVKNEEVNDDDKKIFITEFHFGYEKDADIDDIYSKIYEKTGDRYILNYGVSTNKIFYIVESNDDDRVAHHFCKEVFAKEYNELYHPEKFSDVVFRAKNRLHDQLDDLVDFKNTNLMKFSSTFNGERISILDLDAEKLEVEKESEVQLLTEEEVEFITKEHKTFETIEVYQALISYDKFDEYAAKHNIIGWDLTTPSTLQIKFIEGVTPESQVQKFHDMMDKLDAGWVSAQKIISLDNTKFLSELNTIFEADLAEEFVRRVNKHNIFVRESMAKIRAALVDMEADFNKTLSNEVNLSIDWEGLTAYAAKKERTQHRIKGVQYGSETSGSITNKEGNLAKVNTGLIQGDFYIPISLLSDEIRSKYVIEADLYYIDDVPEYPFYEVIANGHYILIEKTDF